jgi:hypothetical protein
VFAVQALEFITQNPINRLCHSDRFGMFGYSVKLTEVNNDTLLMVISKLKKGGR